MDYEAKLKMIGHEAEGVVMDEAPEHEADCEALIEWLDRLVLPHTEDANTWLELNEEVTNKLRQIRCLVRQGIDSRFDADYYSGRWMG